RVMERWGWIDYRHRVEDFNRPVTTFFPLLPPDASAHEWIEFESPDATGETTRLRLSDQGTIEQAGRKLRRIAAIWKFGTGLERTVTLTIDPTVFGKGDPPPKFLVWSPDQSPDRAARKEVEAFLQGIPSERAYRRGTVRYLKTALRHNAFECRHAAAQVSQEEFSKPGDVSDHSKLYRIDVWLTAAVPFGVLQFDQTIRDGDTGDVLSNRRFTAVANSRSFDAKAERKNAPPKAASALNIPRE
ncbi:MAG TPA: hypothetical protein VHX68_20750, partial [Planctomycetaceae bacterium]|nr:hypothetical protein [Planctomycetaceae bacterium]